MNKLVVTCFIVLAIIQIAAPVKMIQEQHNLLDNGDEIIFEIHAVWIDQLAEVEELRVDIKQNRVHLTPEGNFRDGQAVYVNFDRDEDGLFIPVALSEKKPADSLFVLAKISYIDKDSITATVRYPEMIYYVDKSSIQPQLQPTDARKAYPEPQFLAHGKILNGKTVITRITVNGVDIEDYYNESGR